MPKSSFVDFKAVKTAITMEQVLGHYGLLESFKRSGEHLNGPCPIHKGANPTQFRVSTTKNIWNCFSECKHGGNVLDFIAEMEKVTIHAAALKAIEWFGLDQKTMTTKAEKKGAENDVPAPPTLPKKADRVKEDNIPNKALKFRLEKLEHEHPYIKERGITLETAVDFGIGYCTKGVMAERIAIPIHNEAGEVVAYAGRLPGEPKEDQPKYKLPQGFRKSQELYNIDRAIKENGSGPLIIVEGFFDCMKLYRLGCRKVVALMGSTLSGAQEELIRKHVKSDSRIVLMLDEDEAGKAGREDIAARLSRYCFVRAHQFNQEGMQPDQLTSEELTGILGGGQ